jgi:hypothetical protein
MGQLVVASAGFSVLPRLNSTPSRPSEHPVARDPSGRQADAPWNQAAACALESENRMGCAMSRAPSIVPDALDRDVYLVLDDFGGTRGRAWHETSQTRADRASLIRDLLDGQFSAPVRIVAFNTAEGWSRDVTTEIANEMRRLCMEYGEVSESVSLFLETRSPG